MAGDNAIIIITMINRIKRLQKELISRDLEGILITSKLNRNYLSRFTGTDSLVLVGKKKAAFITDSRYELQSHQEVQGMDIWISGMGKGYLPTALEHISDWKIKQLGFESDHLNYTQYESLKKLLKKYDIRAIPVKGIVEELRLIKDEEEIKLIRKAAQIADRAICKTIEKIHPGVREDKIALEFELAIRSSGAEGPSFETIVASGNRSAFPHGVASDKKIQKGDFVTLDFGAVYKRYNSDCTRTVAVGKYSPLQKEIYEIVKEAQQKSLESVGPGVSAKTIDAIARDIITKYGYGDKFTHSLGHGVGLDIHESPRLSPASDCTLRPGMVITIEPGIYVEGIGGVRIEDLVVVTEKGYQVLTPYSKELVIV